MSGRLKAEKRSGRLFDSRTSPFLDQRCARSSAGSNSCAYVPQRAERARAPKPLWRCKGGRGRRRRVSGNLLLLRLVAGDAHSAVDATEPGVTVADAAAALAVAAARVDTRLRWEERSASQLTGVIAAPTGGWGFNRQRKGSATRLKELLARPLLRIRMAMEVSPASRRQAGS